MPWHLRNALIVVGFALLFLSQRADANCDSFYFSASHSCASGTRCIRVGARASGGGEVLDDFRWSNAHAPLDDELDFTSTDGSSQASARCVAHSTIGAIGAGGVAEASGSLDLGVSSSGTCYAMFRITDLVFSGPTASVETSLFLELDGDFAVWASGSNTTNASANSTLTVRGAVCSANGTVIHPFLGERDRIAEDYPDDPPTVTDRKNSGLLMDHSLNGALLVGPFVVPTGEPLQLEVEIVLDVSAVVSSAGDSPSGSASATSDFANTLGFPANGPIFDLPAGYGVSSEQAGIQVPEPASAIMAFAALGCLAALRLGARPRAS